jgi:hypothetical protein
MKKLILVLLFVFASMTISSQTNTKKAIQLPDGTYFPVKEGETAIQAMNEAMKLYPKSFGQVKIQRQKIMDLDWYNECKLKASTTSNTSILTAIQACEYKAVPKKCRIHNIEKDMLGNEEGNQRIQCVDECNKANFYSKTVGECSTG